MASLEIHVVAGPGAGTSLVIDRRDVISLGRSEENTFALPLDSGISGQHAQITFMDGTCYVEDCGSTNGTFIDDGGTFRRILGPTRLGISQTIKLGRTVLSISEQRHHAKTVVLDRDREANDSRKDALTASPEPAEHLDSGQSRKIVRVELQNDELRYEYVRNAAMGIRSSVSFLSRDLERIQLDILRLASISRQRVLEDSNVQSNALSEKLMEQGLLLAQLAFPKRMIRMLRESDPASLLFVHDASLLQIPWELAVIGDEYLSVGHSFARQVLIDQYSSLYDVSSLAQFPLERPNILIVCNPTNDLEEVQEETERLLETLHGFGLNWTIDYIAGDRVRRLDLLSRLGKCDLVYYVGHADFDNEDPRNSGWRLGDGRLTCEDIRRLPRCPSVVFANGCETGREASWGEGGVTRDEVFGMASAFLVSGVSHYLGSLWPIPPSSATSFARTFFESVSHGASIGEAMRNARFVTRENLGPADLTWASYVLYGDPAVPIYCPSQSTS